jgi:hypothetical protein
MCTEAEWETQRNDSFRTCNVPTGTESSERTNKATSGAIGAAKPGSTATHRRLSVGPDVCLALEGVADTHEDVLPAPNTNLRSLESMHTWGQTRSISGETSPPPRSTDAEPLHQ